MNKKEKKEKEFDFDEEDIYQSSDRLILVEDDEISPEEEAFMKGYEEAEEEEDE